MFRRGRYFITFNLNLKMDRNSSGLENAYEDDAIDEGPMGASEIEDSSNLERQIMEEVMDEVAEDDMEGMEEGSEEVYEEASSNG